MPKQRSIEMVVTKVRLADHGNDFEFWQTQSHEARLAALEEIRREYHQWRQGSEPRLQRVHSIAQR